MFNKSQNQSTPSSEPSRAKSTPQRASAKAPSILGNDLVVTGEISTDGDVQIEGRLEGNIKAMTLTIGKQGTVNGTIKAEMVYIHGKVTGKIYATSVELSETANVLADITQDQLTIANGAFFDGKCSRKTKTAPISAVKSVPKKA